MPMKSHSWPEPPKLNRQPPEIPKTFSSFGISYTHEDTYVYPTDYPQTILNKSEIKRLVEKSYKVFLTLLTSDEDYYKDIEKLEAIHTKLNIMLNAAKYEELDDILLGLKEKQNQQKKKAIENLKDTMNM